VNKLCWHFGLLDPIGKVANILDNLCIKSGDKISTYNVDFMCYVSQLDCMLCYCYYQGLSNWIQDPTSTQEHGKPTLFQNMYTLAMTINHCYRKCDYKYYYVKQAEKETLKSYSQKQEKTSTSGPTVAFQNKAVLSLVVSSTKTSSKSSPSPTPKKQPNTL